MVPSFQKNKSSKDEKHYKNGTILDEIFKAPAPLNTDYDGTNSFWKFWFLRQLLPVYNFKTFKAITGLWDEPMDSNFV